jgi:hypothetical protein
MFICTFCGKDVDAIIACPADGQKYCAECYPQHATIHNGCYTPMLVPLSPNAQRINIARQAQAKYKELPPRLKDTEGTPAPAATTPKVYRGGGGSPDEPPEGAGAPNRPRIEAKRRDHNPP